ncbi:cbb3-type cytochrome c oxidase subunit I, partial [Paenibacillus xylanexedens]|uniref:cbb3-type cytochrome c oxidase subunit I n=1 Tax=Paenibacillus xylanexedens TaxID=528191 RepID=UPI0034D976DE
MLHANFFHLPPTPNPLLSHHIFSIFPHPQLYILIFPPFPIISHLIPTFPPKTFFPYTSILFPTILIPFFPFILSPHHIFTTPLP